MKSWSERYPYRCIHTWFDSEYRNGIRRAISPFSSRLHGGVTPRERSFLLSETTRHEKQEEEEKCVAERTRNGTAPTAGEFHRNIRDHLRYFQRVGSCPAGGKEKALGGGRERERETGKEGKRVQTSRPDLHSERRPLAFLRDRSTVVSSPRPYFSYEYGIFASL